MSEQHTEANPENLYHYEQLRRDRASIQRRGYVLIVVGAGLLAVAGCAHYSRNVSVQKAS